MKTNLPASPLTPNYQTCWIYLHHSDGNDDGLGLSLGLGDGGDLDAGHGDGEFLAENIRMAGTWEIWRIIARPKCPSCQNISHVCSFKSPRKLKDQIQWWFWSQNILYFCQSNTFPESESVLGFISTQSMILTEDSSVKMYRLESPGCVPLLQGVEHKWFKSILKH